MALFGKYLCFAMLALSIDLVWGYCGILSLGHGAFFALGGYAMGMYLMRQIGSRGVYGNAELPDFMVFLNWSELPWYWYGFDQFCVRRHHGACWCRALLAFLFGLFAFRSRVSGVYLSIITQALTFALMLAFFRNDMGFGGNNGLTDFKEILGFNLQAGEYARGTLRGHLPGACRKPRHLPLHHPVAAGNRVDGDPRCGKPHKVSRLSRRGFQALCLHAFGLYCRVSRRAVRAAGRASSIRASLRPPIRSKP